MTEDERHATFDECFEYDDHLRANGHLVAEVTLQPPETALTLYWKNGKVATTDGPYAEPRNSLTAFKSSRRETSIMRFSLSRSNQASSMDLGRLRYGRLYLSEIIKESEQRRRRKENPR